MKPHVVLASAFMSLVIFGCYGLGALFGPPPHFINHPVSSEALVGTWNVVPTDVAPKTKFVRDNVYWGADTPWKSMTLNADGSCVVTIEPSWVPSLVGTQTPLPSGVTASDYYRVSGCTWVLADIAINESETVTGIYIHVPGPWTGGTEPMYINEENGELILWSFIGDPDEVMYLDYRKAP